MGIRQFIPVNKYECCNENNIEKITVVFLFEKIRKSKIESNKETYHYDTIRALCKIIPNFKFKKFGTASEFRCIIS
jgi:hypothetical protein